MAQVNIHEAKTHFSKLVERAVAGEEITIARAGKPMLRLVAVEENEIIVSLVTAWEIAIKVSIGKLREVGDFAALIHEHGFTILPIDLDHIDTVKTLPLHHRDLFDRMMTAQSLAEDVRLISKEAVFDA